VSQFLPSITQTPKWIQMIQAVIHYCDEFPNYENMTGIAEDDSRRLAVPNKVTNNVEVEG